MVLTVGCSKKKKSFENLSSVTFFQNLQTLLGAVSRRNYFLSTQLHLPAILLCRRGRAFSIESRLALPTECQDVDGAHLGLAAVQTS